MSDPIIGLDTPFYTDPEAREAIHKRLHKIAAYRSQNLGSTSTPEDWQAFKEWEIKQLKAVQKYDPAYIKRLLKAEI